MAATDKDNGMAGRRGRTAAVTPLFRDEALAARREQWLGTVVLDIRPWQRGVTWFALLAVAAILALLHFGEFTRTARIGGWLAPTGGLARVFAPQAGVIVALHVKEGAPVKRGEPLATLTAELTSASLGATQAEIARRIQARHRLLVGQREQQARRVEQQRQSYAGRLAALRGEQAQLEREIALQASRAELAGRTEARHRGLREEGFISEQLFQQTQDTRLEQAARLTALERNRTAALRERLALEAELGDLPLKAQADAAALEREIAALDQELAQAEARREIVVTAPADGTVTAILAEPGGQAAPAKPLLSIVPAGSRLEAHLFAPSRAVGFVKPGQRVRLRYQAYPYQKFGHYEGIVASVSRAALNPDELPAPLAGANPVAPTEAVYRITVEPLSQSVVAYGRQVPLQADMRLEAEIALETRRLYEWVLDPLYSLAGKETPG